MHPSGKRYYRGGVSVAAQTLGRGTSTRTGKDYSAQRSPGRVFNAASHSLDFWVTDGTGTVAEHYPTTRQPKRKQPSITAIGGRYVYGPLK